MKRALVSAPINFRNPKDEFLRSGRLHPSPPHRYDVCFAAHGEAIEFAPVASARFLYCACYRERPLFEVNARICNVVAVDGEFFEGNNFGVREAGARCRERNRRAEAQSLKPSPALSKGSLQPGDGKFTDRQEWRQLKQFATRDLFELPRIHKWKGHSCPLCAMSVYRL